MNITRTQRKPDPRRVWLDEKDCERLRRSEYDAVRCLLGAVSYAAHASDDLQERLECIPYGKQRMRMVLGGIRAVAEDLIGTIPVAQCRQIKNSMNDMEIRMAPKYSPSEKNVIIDQSVAKGLIDAAREKCTGCVETGESARECPLYRILEAATPLDDYGDGLMCPYSVTEWE